MVLPKLYRIRQKLNPPVVADVAGAVAAAIRQLPLRGRLKPGGRVAVTAGSRGLGSFATIIRATCDALKELGARPFIVPAMGSHGGATAEGQLGVLGGDRNPEVVQIAREARGVEQQAAACGTAGTTHGTVGLVSGPTPGCGPPGRLAEPRRATHPLDPGHRRCGRRARPGTAGTPRPSGTRSPRERESECRAGKS